jgi:hypothetical protein
VIVVRFPIMPPGAEAFTVWPFVFVSRRPGRPVDFDRLLAHEAVHLEQQERALGLGAAPGVVFAYVQLILSGGSKVWTLSQFAIGPMIGLLVWFAFYLLALPALWNPWRRKWETEAYRSEGLTDEQIDELLSRAPYWLRRKHG